MHHPLLLHAVRGRIRREARKKGYSLSEAIAYAREVDAEQLEDAIASLPKVADAVYSLTEVSEGDVGGELLDRILAFFESDLGKALIKLLLSLIGL